MSQLLPGSLSGILGTFGSLNTLKAGVLCYLTSSNVFYLIKFIHRLIGPAWWYKRMHPLFLYTLFFCIGPEIAYNALQLVTQLGFKNEIISGETFSITDAIGMAITASSVTLFMVTVGGRHKDLEKEVKEMSTTEEAERMKTPEKSRVVAILWGTSAILMLLHVGALPFCAVEMAWRRSFTTFNSCLLDFVRGQWISSSFLFATTAFGYETYLRARRLPRSIYHIWDRRAFPVLLLTIPIATCIRLYLRDDVVSGSLGKVITPSAVVIVFLRGVAQVLIVHLSLREDYARVPLSTFKAELEVIALVSQDIEGGDTASPVPGLRKGREEAGTHLAK